MNNQFQRTFSVVKASDELRSEITDMISSTHARKTANFLPKVLLVAVLITLLVITAYAAPIVLDAIKNGKTEFENSGYLPPTGPENLGPYDRYDLYLDIEMEPNAPKTVDTYYLPELGDGYVQFFGNVWKSTTHFSWTNGAENWEDSVTFEQYPGGSFDPEKPVRPLYVSAGTVPQQQLVELGGATGFLVDFDDMDHGTRLFFWSDGYYLFVLDVPDEYSNERIAQLVESVRLVQDVQPYIMYDGYKEP